MICALVWAVVGAVEVCHAILPVLCAQAVCPLSGVTRPAVQSLGVVQWDERVRGIAAVISIFGSIEVWALSISLFVAFIKCVLCIVCRSRCGKSSFTPQTK